MKGLNIDIGTGDYSSPFGDMPIPVMTAPWWKWALARILGKKVHQEDGYTFRSWDNKIWVFYDY